MKRRSFEDMNCSVAQALEIVGEWWTLLILRDAFVGMQQVQFGMGCFWGAERKFWSLPGVVTTAVGYAGGQTPNANYREVCSGQTGQTEAVLVVYDPALVSFEHLRETFW